MLGPQGTHTWSHWVHPHHRRLQVPGKAPTGASFCAPGVYNSSCSLLGNRQCEGVLVVVAGGPWAAKPRSGEPRAIAEARQALGTEQRFLCFLLVPLTAAAQIAQYAGRENKRAHMQYPPAPFRPSWRGEIVQRGSISRLHGHRTIPAHSSGCLVSASISKSGARHQYTAFPVGRKTEKMTCLCVYVLATCDGIARKDGGNTSSTAKSEDQVARGLGTTSIAAQRALAESLRNHSARRIRPAPRPVRRRGVTVVRPLAADLPPAAAGLVRAIGASLRPSARTEDYACTAPPPCVHARYLSTS